MSSQFQKRTEDFVCEKCGTAVAGNGYTNHCTRCLWSKHVDVHPGDRAATCGGLMEPVAIEGTVARYRVAHRCVVCGYTHKNDVAPSDDSAAMVRVAQTAATKA